MFDSVGRKEEWPPCPQSWLSTITIPLAAGNRQGNEDSDENHPGEVRARRVGSGSNKVILPWHRRSLYEPDAPARGVPQNPRWRVGLVCARMRNFLAGVIVWRWDDEKLKLPVERL